MGGRQVQVAPGAIIRIPVNQVGTDVFIGLYTYLNGDVTIGDHVLIGPHCTLPAGNHKFDPATGYFSARTNKDYDNSIVIGDGCWLASGVTVTAGVKMGKCNLVCVVGLFCQPKDFIKTAYKLRCLRTEHCIPL